MEFGIFIQGYNPGYRREGDPEAEHKVFMNELAAVKAADEAGFKYVWVTEHHFLDEYSHLSANDVITGYLAHSTERIHIGSGIFNPLPSVNHPAKVAERAAMLDHLSNGRFEFGTGRGAGSHEILGFLPGMTDLTGTREIWEDVIGEFPKMWLQDTYEGYQGKFWELPPRKVLPKPYVAPHPPMWYAAGNTTSWEMAGRKGLGVLGFSVGSLVQVPPLRKAYKDAIANAEPVGAYVNDNIMVTTQLLCLEDGARVRSLASDLGMGYHRSLLLRYLDTFPRPDGVPAWPAVLPDPTPEQVDAAIASGDTPYGTPDEVARAIERYEEAGVDQVVFGLLSSTMSRELAFETIETFGKYVLPQFDRDPVHRSTRQRELARAQ